MSSSAPHPPARDTHCHALGGTKFYRFVMLLDGRRVTDGCDAGALAPWVA